MSKYEIKQLDLADDTHEQQFINDLVKKKLVSWLMQNDYTFDKIQEILECKKIGAREQLAFNESLLRCKKETKISLKEMILYFEENFTDFKKILLIFDSTTKFELKKELAENYRIKLLQNGLNEIIES
jgi:hypothetical protein